MVNGKLQMENYKWEIVNGKLNEIAIPKQFSRM